MNKKPYKIVTHSGQFHPDEIFAIAMLKYYFCEINEIVRTRDDEIIEEAFYEDNTILVDVGRIYDPEFMAFDHHQGDCGEFWDKVDGARERTPFSSTGLIYKFLSENGYIDLDDAGLKYLRTTYIIPIDAQDNGVHFFEKVSVLSEFNRNSHDDELQKYQFFKALRVAEMMIENAHENSMEQSIKIKNTKDSLNRLISLDIDGELIYVLPAKKDDNIITTMAYNMNPDIDFFIKEREKGKYGIQTAPKDIRHAFSKKHPVCQDVIDIYDKGNEVEGIAGKGKVSFIHKAAFFTVVDGDIEDALEYIKSIIRLNKARAMGNTNNS